MTGIHAAGVMSSLVSSTSISSRSIFFLAPDAISRPRYSGQPPRRNVLLTMKANSIRPARGSRQRKPNQPKHFRIAVETAHGEFAFPINCT